jgi:hypothetical protein
MMIRTINMKQLFLLAILSMTVVFSFAQDPIKKGEVTVTSAFKPVLRESAKINFNASPPASDSSKPRLQYDIPNQNLLFAYQPGSLKPLAMQIDSGGKWDNNSYIKAGFGSLKTPYIQAGFSFGDGKTAGLNLNAKHVSSQGKRDFQDFTNTSVYADGFFQTAKNIEWNARIGFKSDQTYKYGYAPSTLVFPKDSLKQQFSTVSARLGLHNINNTNFGISYAPEIKIDIFSDNKKNSESNTYVNLPLQKSVGKVFAVNLGITFDLTRFKPDGKIALNNTMYYISPSVLFKTPNFNLQAGVRPSWDNKEFTMFPNVTAEIATDDNRFAFQAGWIGYLRKTSYEYLASQNPWLWVPGILKNTRIEERYAGFKGAAGDHFNYSAKVGFHKINNQPLFVNDTMSGKSFDIAYEKQMKVFHFGAEVGYTLQEKVSLTAGLVFNQYSNLNTYPKAYGLIPLELKAALRIQVLKDLWIKTDLFAWDGPQYRKKNLSSAPSGGAIDLSAGVEFRITKNVNLWAQFNNITNKQYQRWNQYPVYGFNFLGGVIFNFAQKN